MNEAVVVERQSSVLPAPGTISLARGIPAPETFPTQQLAQSAQMAIERHGAVALNYGDPEGFAPLCAWLADHHGVGPEQITITPGSFIGLSFVAEALLHDGRAAAVEAPCYDRMVGVLARFGADVGAVARGADGVDLVALRDALERRPRPAFLYVLPTFHNPTGLTMTLEQREQLVELAVEFELVVVEDDPYGLLRIDGEPRPQVHELLRRRGADQLAVHLSSFSKTVAPGLRVGYIVAPAAVSRRLRELATATYVSPPLFAQAQLYEYLRAGYHAGHLEELCSFLRLRRDALLEVFDARMPPDAAWTRPEGGYFVWLELPQTIDAQELAQRCAATGVAIVAGSGFFAGPGGEHAARLSFSFPTVPDIRAGATRLADLVWSLRR
jgi:2-aminoadipate transaminase